MFRCGTPCTVTGLLREPAHFQLWFDNECLDELSDLVFGKKRLSCLYSECGKLFCLVGFQRQTKLELVALMRLVERNFLTILEYCNIAQHVFQYVPASFSSYAESGFRCEPYDA